MSIDSAGTRVSVFKSHESGIVALCREVVEFIDGGGAERYGLIVSGARFREDREGYHVDFPRIQLAIGQVVGYRPEPGAPETYGEVVKIRGNKADVLFIGNSTPVTCSVFELRPTSVGAQP